MTPLHIVTAVIAAVVLFIALRRRALARIALRSSVRRKGETVLVILGSLLGTAIITGSFLVGDTLDASLRASAETSLGPTDVMVRSANPQSGADAAEAMADFSSPDVDGVLAVRSAIAPTSDAEQDRAQPYTQLVEVDFADARQFGGDAAATGIDGATPQPGHVVLSENLTADLGVGPGDTIVAYAYGVEEELEVDATLPRFGIAGLDVVQNPNTLEFPRNAFVAPGTLDRLMEGATTAPTTPPGTPEGAGQAPPPSDVVLVSAQGGVYDGVDRTDAVVEQIRETVAGVEAVDVEPVKRNILDAAEEQGDQFGELFVAIGSFAVMAGILLLVNIFVMLAEERKSELGMLRAIGLKRRDLMRIFVVEGSAYAAVAAVLGAILGIGVGRAIIVVTSGIFESFGDLTLTFSAPASSIVTGGLIGFVISIVTIVATSLRTSRLNIIRAIRDLPEPAVRARRWWTALLQAVGVVALGLLTFTAIRDGDALLSLAAPAVGAVFVSALLSRLLPRRLVVSVVASLVLAWAVFAYTLVEFEEGDINVFVTQGVVLTASAVALVAQNQELIGKLIRRLGGGSSLVTRLGLAYPLARRFRTSMTLAMYSLVVFTLVFISVMSNTLGSLTDQVVEDEGGGYDIVATSAPTTPLEPAEISSADGVRTVGTMTVGQAQYQRPQDDDFSVWGIGGVDESFFAGGAPALREWDPAYTEEDAVWDAVLADPTLMVADAFFLQGGGGPPEPSVDVGDTVKVRDPASGQVVERTVVAIADAGQTLTAWMSVESVQAAVSAAAPLRHYIDVSDGADATAVALQLQGTFLRNGLQADSFHDLAVQQTRANTQFFRLMQGFLALGLVVGIAGLGVIMVRAVRERRREVGMLRSVGLAASKIRSAFLLESGFVALEGVVIGTLLSLVTSYQLFANSDFFGDIRVPFTIPWAQLSLLIGVSLVASLLATLGPAQQAAKIKPAVALRIAD
jgi:putative ABC transport system permease protein